MTLEICPNCKSDNLGDRWVKGRKLQQHCYDCGWKAEPRIPETIPVETTKEIWVNQFPGFCYTIFDKYGHVSAYSRSYKTKAEAETELRRDIECSNKNEDAKPHTGILWQDKIAVKGKLYK